MASATNPATGIVPVFTLWVKLPIRDEKFIEAMEIRPDNRRVVHHSSVSAAPLPPGTRLGRGAAWDGGPEMDGVPLFRDGKPFRAAGAESFGKPRAHSRHRNDPGRTRGSTPCSPETMHLWLR